jgi:hypothetical protein
LLPVTVSIVLEDFIRALAVAPDLGTPQHTCVVQCLEFCFQYSVRFLNARKFQLFFDQGEPFYGHVRHRMENNKSRAENGVWADVIHCGEADMREVPGLQAADVMAWAFIPSTLHHEAGTV